MESRLGDWTNPAPPPKARHKAIGIMRQRPLPSLKEMLLLASVLLCYRPLSPLENAPDAATAVPQGCQSCRLHNLNHK